MVPEPTPCTCPATASSPALHAADRAGSRWDGRVPRYHPVHRRPGPGVAQLAEEQVRASYFIVDEDLCPLDHNGLASGCECYTGPARYYSQTYTEELALKLALKHQVSLTVVKTCVYFQPSIKKQEFQ